MLYIKYLPGYTWLVCALILFTSGTWIKSPVVIEGKLLEEGTGKPVSGAYLRIVTGEEETLSGNDGSFILESWQRLPVQCTIEHRLFSEKKLMIKKETRKLVILLKQQ